jgi:hypothetical protein
MDVAVWADDDRPVPKVAEPVVVIVMDSPEPNGELRANLTI